MFVNYDNRLRSWLRFTVICINQMSDVSRNPVFGVSDQVRRKPDCTFIGDGKTLEISDLGRSGIVISV